MTPTATAGLRDAGGPAAPEQPPRAFAGAAGPSRAELLAVPIRWPRPSRLSRPVQAGRGRMAQGLKALGIETVGDLLAHLPSDRREARALAELKPGEAATVAVEVERIAARPVRRRGMRPLVEATVFDESGSAKAHFFNQPWLAERYRPGTRLVLHGKLDRGSLRVWHHAIGSELGSLQSGEVAHYPASEGISSTQILTLVRACAQELCEVLEPLPAAVRVRERLPALPAALRALHFPEGERHTEEARRRLAFEELLRGQLSVMRRRRMRGALQAVPLRGPRELTERWLAGSLPFEPTADQRAAMARIDRDLAREVPMQRLLMGEVGSGKTVVALYTMLRAVEHGMQAALMAPTETLAEQHFATLQALLDDALISSALLTGSTAAARRGETLARLASGELQLVVGTHALIEEGVRFARLGVVVVDEQHRFGVAQRSALDRKGEAHDGAGAGGQRARGGRAPHLLHMTATPIPRTLALTLYGDLDVTRLHELPRGRLPVVTEIAASERERAGAYERLRSELRAGRQAFVVCPLVEESEQLQARAARSEFERLQAGELRDFRLALLHGQMRPREKQQAMAAFLEGEADVLVATTVIEVGIDVPNATVMLVEDADRYGISQLHQLRGRVGRGRHGGLCVLCGPRGSRRLQALAQHADGFELAEVDLRLRGEGELAGLRQSGQAALAVARLPEDAPLLQSARRWAEEVMETDPELRAPEHALLAESLGEDALRPLPA